MAVQESNGIVIERGRSVPDGRVTGPKLYLQQLEVLLQKNATLAWRNRAAFFVQLMATVIFILLIFGIDRALQTQDKANPDRQNIPSPAPFPINQIPDCSSQLFIRLPCLTIIYAPAGAAMGGNGPTTVGDMVMKQLMADNNPPIPSNRVMGFNTTVEMDNYMSLNYQTVTSGVEFMPRYFQNVIPPSSSITNGLIGVDFGLQVNGTVKPNRGRYEDLNFFVQMPLQNAVQRTVSKLLLNTSGSLAASSFSWDVQLSEFAHPALSPFSYVGAISPTFLLAAAMFTFVIQVSNVIIERELKLRGSMRVMGLQDSLFWASWLLWEVCVMNFISSITIVVVGMIFQFDLFLNNSFGVLFFLFWLFELAMTGLGYWISTFLAKSNSGTFVGFIVFLFGFIIMLVVNTGGIPYDTAVLGDEYAFLCYIFSMFPPAILAKCIRDLGEATATKELGGIPWAERDSYCSSQKFSPTQSCSWSIDECYGWLLLDFLIFMVLAFYFDNVNPNEYGVRKSYLFFLEPSYWTGRPFKPRPLDVEGLLAQGRSAGSELPTGLDSDVAAEEASVTGRLRNGGQELEHGVAVEVRGLVKSFGSFHAVKGNWFRIENGKLFALLGPNGAGKTTTINCLTGVLPITAGNAVVNGHSVADGGISAIRNQMGVCPQFDMLWGELTGREHLRMYAAIKGLPRSQWDTVVNDLLEHTKLTSAADRRAATFSGGMKRRLSVAVALIGDPAVLYLDEPTTGMDPITRRYVWDIVLAAKTGRAIVLTTHSMEEADVLADNIAIIAKGRLRCLGSSLRLKSKFGAGYRISASVLPNSSASMQQLQGLDEATISKRRDGMKRFFKDRLGVGPSEDGKAYTQFIVRKDKESELAAFLTELAASKEQLGITDLQMGLTTLEEVFLTIARDAERTAALAENKTAVLGVTIDGALYNVVVPWGAHEVELPTTGETLHVEWSQDDEGRLVYAGHTLRGVREVNHIDNNASKNKICCCC